MSRLLTNRRLFVLLVSFIIVVVLAGLTLRSRSQSTPWPERVVMDVENTVGALIYRPVSQATAFLGGIRSLHDMYVENAQLKSEMQDYLSLKAQLKDAMNANTRLNKMIGFKQSTGKAFTSVPAHVIGRDPSQWNSDLTIDAGTAQGVQDNMAVVNVDGSLVGRVFAAGAFSSKVVLITDTDLGDGVSARVQTPGADQPFGIVTGSTTISGALELNFLSPLAQVKPGDTVVTSGLSNVFPRGIVIGTVQTIRSQQELTKSAVVQPTADFDYLQDVFVITSRGAGS